MIQKQSSRPRGRRSVKESVKTREHILVVSTCLFCEHGYEAVSLRRISQQAGVSHASVSHHFGTKENLWDEVGNYLHLYMQLELKALIEHIYGESSPKRKLYMFSVYVLANAISFPYPVKYLSEASRNGRNYLGFASNTESQFESFIQPLLSEYENIASEADSPAVNLKWLLLSSCYSAIGLSPHLTSLFNHECDNLNEALFRHWRIFNGVIANYCGVTSAEQINPKSLEEMLIDIAHPLRIK